MHSPEEQSVQSEAAGSVPGVHLNADYHNVELFLADTLKTFQKGQLRNGVKRTESGIWVSSKMFSQLVKKFLKWTEDRGNPSRPDLDQAALLLSGNLKESTETWLASVKGIEVAGQIIPCDNTVNVGVKIADAKVRLQKERKTKDLPQPKERVQIYSSALDTEGRLKVRHNQGGKNSTIFVPQSVLGRFIQYSRRVRNHTPFPKGVRWPDAYPAETQELVRAIKGAERLNEKTSAFITLRDRNLHNFKNTRGYLVNQESGWAFRLDTNGEIDHIFIESQRDATNLRHRVVQEQGFAYKMLGGNRYAGVKIFYRKSRNLAELPVKGSPMLLTRHAVERLILRSRLGSAQERLLRGGTDLLSIIAYIRFGLENAERVYLKADKVERLRHMLRHDAQETEFLCFDNFVYAIQPGKRTGTPVIRTAMPYTSEKYTKQKPKKS